MDEWNAYRNTSFDEFDADKNGDGGLDGPELHHERDDQFVRSRPTTELRGARRSYATRSRALCLQSLGRLNRRDDRVGKQVM